MTYLLSTPRFQAKLSQTVAIGLLVNYLPFFVDTQTFGRTLFPAEESWGRNMVNRKRSRFINWPQVASRLVVYMDSKKIRLGMRNILWRLMKIVWQISFNEAKTLSSSSHLTRNPHVKEESLYEQEKDNRLVGIE